MYRYIRNSEDTYDEWDMYQGKKYRVIAVVDGGPNLKPVCTNDAAEAIETWFKYAKKHPMDAAIMTKKRADGVALLEVAVNMIEPMYRKYGCYMKQSYVEEAIQKKIDDGCRGLVESDDFGDQIHPFCFG